MKKINRQYNNNDYLESKDLQNVDSQVSQMEEENLSPKGAKRKVVKTKKPSSRGVVRRAKTDSAYGETKKTKPDSKGLKVRAKKQTKSRVKTKQTKAEKHQPDSLKDKRDYRKYCLEKFKEFNNNGKMTVAIFCDTFFPIVDGVISVMDNYAKRLDKKCNIVMVVPEHKGKTYKKDYLVIGIKSLFLKFVNYDLAFPSLDFDLSTLLAKLRIDIIHLHSPFFVGFYAVALAKRRKIPIITTFHSQYKQDFYKNTNSKSLSEMLTKTIMTKVFNKSTEVWTMHDASRNTLIDYGFKGSTHLIPNATDFVRQENISELVQNVNKKYGLGDAQNVFLFVGRLIETKNILFIADVLAEIKSRGLNFKMVYVGTGPDEDKLKAKIRALDLEKEIILTGKITDKAVLSGLYERADLFLFPSMYDVSSIVQIEAACFELPVIFAEGAVTACTVTKDVNGFVEKLDTPVFAQKVMDIVNDKQKLAEVGKNAREQLYVGWEDVVDGAFERYKMLIETNKQALEQKKNKIKANRTAQ